jgi:hypothetical protein
VCDLETSRIGAPYIYDISNLRVNGNGIDNYNILNKYPQSSLQGPVKESRQYSDELLNAQKVENFLTNYENTSV